MEMEQEHTGLEDEPTLTTVPTAISNAAAVTTTATTIANAAASQDDTEMEEITNVYSLRPLGAGTTRPHSCSSLRAQVTNGFCSASRAHLVGQRGLRCASADTVSPSCRLVDLKAGRREVEDGVEAVSMRTSSSKRLKLSVPDRSTESACSIYVTCPDCRVVLPEQETEAEGSTDPAPAPLPALPHPDKGWSSYVILSTTDPPPDSCSKPQCWQGQTASSEKPGRSSEERGGGRNPGEQKRVPADPERLKHRARRRRKPWSSGEDDVDWSSLPSVALMKIYRCLGDVDRVRMSSTCTRWRKGFFSPALWRRASLRPTSRGFLFASLLGRHVRKLRLNCENVWSPTVFKSMLEALKTANLLELEFVDFAFGLNEWPQRKAEILGAVEDFAGSQAGLASVRLGQMELSREEGCRLVAALPPGLRQLGIEVLFSIAPSSTSPVFQDGGFWDSLHGFQQLQELRVAYDCISDEQVWRLSASPLGRRLARLSLHLYEDTARRHVIQSATWRELTSSNPRLLVKVHAEDVDEEGLKRVLVWGLPLQALELMYTGDTDPGHEAGGVSSVLIHIAAHFPQLQELCLDDFTSQSVDDGLQMILTCCKGLTCLQFYGTLTKDGMENIFSYLASDAFNSLRLNLELVDCAEEALLKDLASWVRLVKPAMKIRVLLNSEDV